MLLGTCVRSAVEYLVDRLREAGYHVVRDEYANVPGLGEWLLVAEQEAELTGDTLGRPVSRYRFTVPVYGHVQDPYALLDTLDGIPGYPDPEIQGPWITGYEVMGSGEGERVIRVEASYMLVVRRT